MADQKVSALTEDTSPTADDLVYLVNDPGGTPGDRKATVGNVNKGIYLLEQHTASTSASLDFTSFISSTYDEYLFEFLNILPATDGALLWMRMNTGGGFDSGANYSYRYLRVAGATAIVTAGGATKIILCDAADDNALWGISGQLRLYSPQNTSVRKVVSGHLVFEQTAAGGLEQSLFFGVYDVTTALTQVQFLMSTGNITSGDIRCYGVKK